MLVVHFSQRIFGRASRFGGARLERYHEIPMFVDSAHISVYSSPALLQALIRFWVLEVNLLNIIILKNEQKVGMLL